MIAPRTAGTDILADLRAAAGADFDVVYADPPWALSGNSEEKPGRNPRRHYPTMSLEAIEALPVRAIVNKPAALFMWITTPLLVTGAHIPIMRAWGFEPTAFAFTWVKTKRNTPWHAKIGPDQLHIGTGHTTRKNTEVCILGKRHRSLRVARDVHEVIIAPVREHSRKPDEALVRIKRYVGNDRGFNRSMVELFSRETFVGVQALGRDVGRFDVAA